MEMQQEKEWKAAQSTVINVDLVSAAKTQLKFLAAVDRNRWLYEGPGLDRAIYRYNAFWLPLLANHSKSPVCEGPLVVPLDCEWIWHCHRLNPVRYKSDCVKFYGKILDNRNVASSLAGVSSLSTEKAWKTLYPNEPFELDMATALVDTTYAEKHVEKSTKYDLISAVQRQSPFFYQVSRLHMNDDRYLEGAVARYKGFLHIIKRNVEKSIQSFSVPTYDIDLIWHTHQLHPVSYCSDLMRIMGKILEHDDTDSDRTKGQKLDTGFSGTTKTFEEMFGTRYWRAGAMYRGSAPSPVRNTPYTGISARKSVTSDEYEQLTLPKVEAIEVMLEFVGIRNLPVEQEGSLFVSFSKTQPDEIFDAKRSLTIFSESGEKQVASFQCEPTGNLIFELVSWSKESKSSKTIGTAAVPFKDLLSPESPLIVEKWLEMVPSTNITSSNPIGLRVAISVTIPTPLPYELHIKRSSASPKNSCMFTLPVMVQFSKSWTRVVDENGNLVLSLQMRDSKKSKGKKEYTKKEVIGIIGSGKTRTLAEFTDSRWSIVNSPWSIQLPSTNNDDGHLLELTGPKTVRLFAGGRMDYEKRHCEKHKHENKLESHLVTAVEFSAECPYGTAVALLDLESGTVKVKDDWFVFPGCLLTFILGDILEKGYNSLILSSDISEKGLLSGMAGVTDLAIVQKEVTSNDVAVKANAIVPTKGGGCGGGCGSGCGNGTRAMESGGCGGSGGGGGGGCGNGNIVKSGGCGSGCGGGCGDMVRSGGCGSSGGSGGCGSSCGNGNAVKASGGGGGCSNGNAVKSSGCGGGSGCGNGKALESSVCGGGCGGSGGCGGGCSNGNAVKSSGCGGGCGGGGGCGNGKALESSGCGSGCGGGCGGGGGCGNGKALKSSGCGGVCGGGGGCGNGKAVKSSGCGGGCGGGGCGN